MDVKNDGPSKSACTDIIKRGVRQQRYLLKRKHFDPSMTKEQLLARQPPAKIKRAEWKCLLDYWFNPKSHVHA